MHDIKWTPEKVARIWDYYATNSFYNNKYFGAHSGQYVVDYLTKNIPFEKCTYILDFGCGLGDIINYLLPKIKSHQKIYGLDFSEDSITHVAERFKQTACFKGAELVKSLPSVFDDNMFDLILTTETVEHLEDTELNGMLGECYRLLKSGGVLFLTTPNNENMEMNNVMCPECGCKFHRWQHVRSWTEKSLNEKLIEYNFQNIKTEAVGWYPTSRKLLNFIKPYPKTGLVYLGKKK